MKILWSINTVPKNIAEKSDGKIRSGHAISWVDAMAKALAVKTDISLFMVAPGGKNVKHLENISVDGITYYILPKDCEQVDYWGKIIDQIKPDVIHAYGTEKRHNLILIEKYSNKVPIIISLQGIISEYTKYYYAGLSKSEIIKNYTIDDVLHKTGIFTGKLSFIKQSKYEKYMLQNVNYVEGRSDWDYAFSNIINPDLKYFYCPRMIRSDFFDYDWCIDKCEKHSILVHQGNYPIKGLHFMLDALKIIITHYPNAKLYVSGNNFMESRSKNGYIKIIRKKIKELHLENNIEFTGFLDAKKLAEKLSKVNVCVIPSAIENAPNALAEAMIVGTPVVASYVGGNADMLNYGECGLLYRYDEPEMLALRIDTLFSDENTALQFSQNSREVSRNRHNSQQLVTRILDIYSQVIDDFI